MDKIYADYQRGILRNSLSYHLSRRIDDDQRTEVEVEYRLPTTNSANPGNSELWTSLR